MHKEKKRMDPLKGLGGGDTRPFQVNTEGGVCVCV